MERKRGADLLMEARQKALEATKCLAPNSLGYKCGTLVAALVGVLGTDLNKNPNAVAVVAALPEFVHRFLKDVINANLS